MFGCGAFAECGSRYGPGGLGYELVALAVGDLLGLEALRWLQVLLWDAGVLVCVAHDGRFLSSWADEVDDLQEGADAVGRSAEPDEYDDGDPDRVG